jgi:uncharacterized damage-inducible protein DinB
MATVWTAPVPERVEPDLIATERQSLEHWLEFHRATLLMKCAGLSGEELKKRPVAPSRLSLLGLVRHMTEVEQWWFRMHAGNEQIAFAYSTESDETADFDAVEDADEQADLARFRVEIAAARAAVAGKSLDDVVASRGHHPEQERDIRWIYLHMIEEYARHNGHADLIRECIDGTVGD